MNSEFNEKLFVILYNSFITSYKTSLSEQIIPMFDACLFNEGSHLMCDVPI